jgi:CDP-diacylglycerol--serine O-phosphatidyltransferase
LAPYQRLGWLAAFLFLTCGALRLARFNVNSALLPKNYFQGLPIPMAAGVIATFIIFSETLDWPSSRATVMLILTFSLSSLMVSTIQFPSFKELNWRSRATFGYLLVGVLIMILIAVKPEITLFLILSVYIGVSLVLNLFRKLFRSSVPSSSKSENRSTSVIL